jgi:hypothetical protein
MITNQKEWIAFLRETSLLPGSPIKQKSGFWEVTERKETWKAIGPRLFDEHLERFRQAAIEVFSERDPKFDLEPEQRFAASIYGKILRHSEALRSGLAETLALLGSFPEPLSSCSDGKAKETAARAVYEILKGADWVLWATLNSNLPALAEAAPEIFLGAVENAICQDASPFTKVFAQESPGIMGQNYLTGLLWALETLAWHPDYLQRVTVLLGDLAAIDPGGNWLNRPENSLTNIFLPWHVQTTATVAKRKAAITALVKEQPGIGWKLLIRLLPGRQTTSGCHKPSWRKFIAEDWPENVTNAEYREQVEIYAGMLIEMAGKDIGRMPELLKNLPRLPVFTRPRALEIATSDQIKSLPEASRLPIWESLTKLVSKHRQFPTAEWALPTEALERIEDAASKLAPTSIDLLHKQLFSERDFALFTGEGTHQDKEKNLTVRRQTAVRDILSAGELPALMRFARQVAYPAVLGETLGRTEWQPADAQILPAYLDATDNVSLDFVRAFIWGRLCAKGWDWADTLRTDLWTPKQKAAFFANLPFGHETWRRAEAALGTESPLYWKTAQIRPYGSQLHLVEAVQKLLDNSRPVAALSCLNRLIFEKIEFPWALAVRALLEAQASPELSNQTDGYELGEIIKWLQENPATDREALCKIEWAYLPLLDRDYGGRPKTLENELATNPAFFCEVISAVFRSGKDDATDKVVSEQDKNIAQQAYRLLDCWQIVPGTNQDGKFEPERFENWYAEVRRRTFESGHLRIALDQIGKALAYSPKDADGLWIHSTIAEALNSRDAGEMRSGFTCELFNMRGTHGFSHGQEERRLAADFNAKADALEARGYERIATAVRGLAKGYEEDAKRGEKRTPLEA